MAIPFLKGIDVAGTVDLSNLTIDSAQGTDGQVLTSTGSGIAWEDASGGASLSGGAANKLAIWSGTDTLTNDTNLHWDTSNDRLGIGTTNPNYALHVNGQIYSESSTYPVYYLKRNTSAIGGSFDTTSGIASAFKLETDSSGTITDGFGGGIVFSLGDTSPNTAARIYARRDGGDQTGALQFWGGVNGNTALMTMRASGNIGIGTTSPTATLHLKKSNANNGLRIISDSLYNGFVQFGDSEDDNIGRVVYSHSENSMTFFTNDTERLQINSSGDVDFILDSITDTRSLNFPYYNASNAKTKIKTTATGDFRQHFDILMNTAQSDSVPTSVLRIQNNGNIGIGTSNPADPFHLAMTNGDIRIDAETDRNHILSRNAGNSDWRDICISATSGQDQLILDTNGRVGIGTSSPSSKLQVNGGHLRVDNSGGTDNYYLEFYESGAQRFRIYENSNNVYFDGGPGNTHFRPRQGGGSNNFIVTGANVGIGTASPTTGKLVVHGGDIEVRDSTGNSGGRIKAYDDNHAIYFREGGSNQINYYEYGDNVSAGGGHRFFTGGTKPNQTLKLQIGNDYTQINNSTRSPIFYDSSNTGYYLDPASTGISAYLRGDIEIINEQPLLELNDYTATSTTNLNAWVSFQYNGTEGGYVGYGSDGNSNLYLSNYNGSVLIAGASAETDNSFRAPVFYDSNDTGYYANPAGTSNLNALNVGGSAVWTSGNDGSGSGLDADLLDGVQGSGYLRSDANDTFTGKLSVGDTNIRRAGIYGIYDSYRIGHIWSMGTGYNIANDGSDFGNLYGLAYKHTNNTTGGTMGNSHQMVWCNNGSPRGSIGYSSVWHAESMKAPIFYDSNDTNYKLDPNSTSNLKHLNVAGTFRFQRSSYTQTGQDDNVSVTVGDSDITFRHNNDDDGDASVYNFQYRSGGNDVDILNFASSYAAFNTPYVRCRNNSTDYAQLESNSSGGVFKAVSNGNTNVLFRSYGDSYTTNNFGIGTSSPVSNARLTILGADATLLIQDTTTSYTQQLAGIRLTSSDSSGNPRTDVQYRLRTNSTIFEVTYGASDSWRFKVDGGGNTYSATSSRAPVFYDSNNTSYYANPSSNSKLYQLSMFGSQINSGQVMLVPDKTSYSSGGGFTNMTYRKLNSYLSYTPETVVSFQWNTSQKGSIGMNAYGTQFNTSSDYRLKENAVILTDGIQRVKQLQPKRFNFIGFADQTLDGFLAHEVSDIVPEAVTGEKDAVDENNDPVHQVIDQSKIVPLLTAALKEAISKIEDLETRIQILENQ